MNSIEPALTVTRRADSSELSSRLCAVADRTSWRRFLIAAGGILAVFCVPLWQLINYALRTEIASHILLIPFISAYLWRISRPTPNSNPNPNLTPTLNHAVPPSRHLGVPILSAFCGIVALIGYFWLLRAGRPADALTFSTLSLLCFLFSAAFMTLGWTTLRPKLFAIAFLLFVVPLPSAFIEILSILLQRASAEAADIGLRLTGMPVFRNGMEFKLAGLNILVAEECSGIRSTLVLFITSILAARLFLQTGWKRILFVMAVVPIGIIRNGFRITIISWLTVNVDSRVIDSPLHHRGGPIFFILSLIPLFAVLWMLRRSEPAIRKSKHDKSV
jgi:exosortase C (VPDSG-CTERM-specific)